MEIITLRNKENEKVIYINDFIDFDIAMNYFQDFIIDLKEKSIEEYQIISIDLGKRMINSSDLLLLFDIVLNEEYLLLKGINCVHSINSKIEIYEGTIRGGQYLTFDNSVLIVGDVNINSTIVAKNNIYIIGKSSGKLISTSKDSKICASSFINSMIQIYDSDLELINSKDSTTLIYDNNLILINKNSQLKGDNYVKSNCSYIG